MRSIGMSFVCRATIPEGTKLSLFAAKWEAGPHPSICRARRNAAQLGKSVSTTPWGR